MSRTNEKVRIRVAARDSANAQIKALVAEANARINASYDRSEMVTLADKTIFKINRLLTADAIEHYAEKNKYMIGEMDFLTSDEKKSLSDEIDSLKASSAESAGVAENLTVLGFIWSSFDERLQEIYRGGNEKNLSRSKDEHLYLFENEVDKLSADLRSMIYLSSVKCDEYLKTIGYFDDGHAAEAVVDVILEKAGLL
jgi:hypothetical protein